MDYSNIYVGERLCLLRNNKDMTQEQLASMLSVKEGVTISPKHVSAVERGVSGLSLELLIQISHIFECSLDYLVFGESSDELSRHVPEHIQEIYRSNNDTEITLLNSYLEMYKKLRERNE